MTNETQTAGLAVQQAAVYLGVSTRTIYNLLNTGEIKAKKLGAKTIIPRESLNKYLESLRDYASTAGVGA